MTKGKMAAVLNRVSAINILICTLFLIWYSRVERSFFNSDYLWDLWDLWQLGLYLLDFVLPVLAVSVIFFIKTKRKKLGTVTKKEIIVSVIEWIYVLTILITSLYLICVDWLWYDMSWALYRFGELLCFVNLVLGISEIFLVVTKMKKLGTVTKKEKIVTFINQFFGLYILVCTIALVYLNYDHREVSAAGAAGIGGGCVRELVVCEILFICSSVYLNKIHKSGKADGATGEKIPLTS